MSLMSGFRDLGKGLLSSDTAPGWSWQSPGTPQKHFRGSIGLPVQCKQKLWKRPKANGGAGHNFLRFFSPSTKGELVVTWAGDLFVHEDTYFPLHKGL